MGWSSSILLLVIILCGFISVSSSAPACDVSNTFLNPIHLTCPLQISSSLPHTLQMDGESLERVLRSTSNNVQIAVLFYDSKCPFSSTSRFRFDILSSMFPQLGHFAVEKSLVLPSLFSRYGIHSLPALFIVNQTSHTRYYGAKDLHSFIQFYKSTTGLDPTECCAYNDDMMKGQMILPWYQLSWREIIVKEPFLVFAVLFLVLRASIHFCRGVLSCIMAFWNVCKRQLNLGIIRESSQLLGRVLHLIDVKRVGRKLNLHKTRNFQQGARNARVWASSLASVSLGETSLARQSPSVDS